MSELVPLFVVIPLASAFLIPVIGRFVPWFQKSLTLLVLLFLTILSLSYLFTNTGETLAYKVGGWENVEHVPIAIFLVLDGLSGFIVLIINMLGFLSAFYAVSYINKYTAENNFYALLCLMIAGMNGVALTGDLFNLYVFLEIAVIASYALVAFGIERNQLEASFKYQVLGGIASILILFGVGMIYWLTKTLNFADASTILAQHAGSPTVTFIQVMLVVGFGLKAAMIPFHAWLPDAHSSAPSPISAMLSGVLIKAIGIYALIRLFFNVFTISSEIAIVITTIGALSMVIGGLLALRQWDVKRLFAFSSISQVGYVAMAIGIGMIVIARGGSQTVASLAIAGGLFHLINHAVFKGLLFLNAGAIEYRINTRNLKEMGNLAQFMPWTASTSFGASMSVAGIPPFAGFFSKLLIIIAAIKGGFFFLAALAVLVSVLTISMYMKYQRYAFFNKAHSEDRMKIKDVPFPMAFSMVIMGVLCLIMSLLIFPGVREIILDPAVDVLMKSSAYATTIIGM
ncbi:MAG: hypothetical protein K9I94_13985 [Bacteroidales bacterium]|nr:hypothetical protein [Bacteroidales bacterium]